MATNEVKVRFIVSDDGTLKVLDEAGRKLGDIENKAGGTTRAMSSLAGGIGAVVGAATAATGALAAIGVSALHEADRVNELRQQLGLTATELTSYSVSAKLGGVGLESFGQSLGFLNKQIAAGNPLLKELGVQGRDTNTVLSKLSDVFARLPDGPEKTAIAYQLLGRSGRELIPTLNEGSAALERNAELGRRLGVVYGDDVAQAADKFFDSIDTLGLGVKGLALGIGIDLLPTLNNSATAMVEWSAANREFVASGINTFVAGPMVAAFSALGYAIDQARQGWEALRTLWNGGEVAPRGATSPQWAGVTADPAIGPQLPPSTGGADLSRIRDLLAADLSRIRDLLARSGGSPNPTQRGGSASRAGTADPSIGPQLPTQANIPSAEISQQLTRQLEVVGESVTVDLGESLADSIKSAVTALISRDDGFDLKDAFIAVGQQWGAQIASGMVDALVSGKPLQFVGGGGLFGGGQSVAAGGRFVPTAIGQPGYTATTGYGLSYVPGAAGSTTIVDEFGQRYSGPAGSNVAGAASGVAGSVNYGALGVAGIGAAGSVYGIASNVSSTRRDLLDRAYSSPPGQNLVTDGDIVGKTLPGSAIGGTLAGLGVGLGVAAAGLAAGSVAGPIGAVVGGLIGGVVSLFIGQAPTIERQIAKQLEKTLNKAGLPDATGPSQVRAPGDRAEVDLPLLIIAGATNRPEETQLSKDLRSGNIPNGTVFLDKDGLPSVYRDGKFYVPDLSPELQSIYPTFNDAFVGIYGNKNDVGLRASNAFINRAQTLGLSQAQATQQFRRFVKSGGLELEDLIEKAGDEFILQTQVPGFNTVRNGELVLWSEQLAKAQEGYFAAVESLSTLLADDLPKGVDATELAFASMEEVGERIIINMDKFNERLDAQVSVFSSLAASLENGVGSGLDSAYAALLSGGNAREGIASSLQAGALQAVRGLAVDQFKQTPAFTLLQDSLASLVRGLDPSAIGGVRRGISQFVNFATNPSGPRAALDIVNYAFLPDSLRANATALSTAATDARISLLSPRRRRGALLGQLGELDARIGTITADNVIDYSEAALYQQLIGQRGALGQQIVGLGGRRNVQLGSSILDETARMAERSASLVERQNTLLEGLNLTMSQLILVLSGNLSWLEAGKLSEAQASERVLRLNAKYRAATRAQVMGR